MRVNVAPGGHPELVEFDVSLDVATCQLIMREIRLEQYIQHIQRKHTLKLDPGNALVAMS